MRELLLVLLFISLFASVFVTCNQRNALAQERATVANLSDLNKIKDKRILEDSTEIARIAPIQADYSVLKTLLASKDSTLQKQAAELKRLGLRVKDVRVLSTVKLEFRDTGRTVVKYRPTPNTVNSNSASSFERVLRFNHSVVPSTITIRQDTAYRDFKINPIGITFAVTEQRRLFGANRLSIIAASDTKGISFSSGNGIIQDIKKPKASIGFSIGYGAMLVNGKIQASPFIGVSIHKPIIQF